VVDSAVILLGGTAVDFDGIFPPAPDGVTKWYQFAGADAATALRNLVDVDDTSAVAVGAPTFPGTYFDLPGTSDKYVQPNWAETPSFGFLALVRMPDGVTASHRILSSFGSGNSGLGWYFNSSGALLLASNDTGAPSPTGPNTGAQLAGTPGSGWRIVGATSEEEVGRSLYDFTAATSAFFARTQARVVGAASPRMGTTHQATPSTPGRIQVASIAFTSGRCPSAAEMRANAGLMQILAAEVGITVALA
jgi:hypothetical protein